MSLSEFDRTRLDDQEAHLDKIQLRDGLNNALVSTEGEATIYKKI